MASEEHTALGQALQKLLDNHTPYPAVAVDAAYGIVCYNRSFERMVASKDKQ